MTYPTLRLKKGKEANLGFRHPWVFSGALEVVPPESELAHGALVHVADRAGRVIGTGTFSRHSMIAVRVCEFARATIDAAWIRSAIARAVQARELVGLGDFSPETTGYRVIFGEADQLPGLVVDRYADVLVVQISTQGMDALKSLVVDALQDAFHPRAIVERLDVAARAEERLPEQENSLAFRVLAGALDPEQEQIAFVERGLKFLAPVMTGQKTGFFLDQKELRVAIERLARGRRILNVFSYTGAHGIAALRGGAASVHHVDASQQALDLCRAHTELNGFDATSQCETTRADAFAWMGEQAKSALTASSGAPLADLIILDPPALIKSKKDAEMGQKAYHFINRAAFRLAGQAAQATGKPAILVTSSCSHYLSEEDFGFLLRRASVQAGVSVRVMGVVRQASDHPESIYFPESSYLKSFILSIDAYGKKE